MSFGESLRSAEARSRSPMVLYPVPGIGKKTPGEPVSADTGGAGTYCELIV